MQVMFHKIPTVLVVASVYTCEKQSGRRLCHTHDQSCVARRRVSGLALITDNYAKMLKMQHIFAYNGLPGGLPPRSLHFYRATLCIARTMPWQDVWLSACLSVHHTPVLSVNGYAYPQIFLPSVSVTILVFPYQMGWEYSDGKPLNGGVERKGYEKNHDFRPISRFISQMMQDRAIVTMEGE